MTFVGDRTPRVDGSDMGVDEYAAGTLGVEEEFLLVDPVSRATVSNGPKVLRRAQQAGGLPRGAVLQPELVSTQVEAATGVCTQLEELAGQVRGMRAHVGSAAQAEGTRLVSVAHPVLLGDAPTVMPGTRFARISEAYAQMIWSYQACGCHIHVGVPDRATAVMVINHLRPWLPTLLAISANSAYDRGRDTGYHSWRMVLQSRFPGAGVPPVFGSVEAYEHEIARLVDCGVLVDPKMTFWLARPSERFTTVEIRAADAATSVDDAVLYAALARALVRTCLRRHQDEQPVPDVPDQLARAALWSAARYGLAGPGIDPVSGVRVPATELFRRLLDHVRPALEDLGDAGLVRRLVTRLLHRGTGAERQRQAAASGGPPGVVDMLIDQTVEHHESTHETGRSEMTGVPAAARTPGAGTDVARSSDRPRAGPRSPSLPRPRGPLSTRVVEALAGTQCAAIPDIPPAAIESPYDDDPQLALYTCYELHYRSFAGVDERWEWEPQLLALRNALENAFLEGLRRDVPGRGEVAAALDPLLVEPVDAAGVSHHLRDAGQLGELREFIAMRSLYHLKEADPHAWVIPRLQGQAKASLVGIEYDEFGAGSAARAHSQLFADLMIGLDLEPEYGHYLDVAPAQMLATVNLMSMLGLHRSLRGALVGHFAAAEITTAPSARRMAQAMERLAVPDSCKVFYTEHIEADAVHEQVMRHDVIGDLLRREPELAPDVIFGVEATSLLEDRLTDHVMGAWSAGRSALSGPI
jgi:YbdK family carboxylate-amine ligase